MSDPDQLQDHADRAPDEAGANPSPVELTPPDEAMKMTLKMVERFSTIEAFQKLSAEEQADFKEYFRANIEELKRFFLPLEREKELMGQTSVEQHTSQHLGDVIVIAGPSGVGKDTVIEELLERNPDMEKVVTATTRGERPGEEEGVAYHFMSREMYRFLHTAKLFVDHVEYAGNLYGMPTAELEKRTRSEAIIINVVPETAKILKGLITDAKVIFILPPSDEEQFARLSGRGTESEAKILERIQADKAMFGKFADVPDYTIISEDGRSGIEKAATQIEAIIRGE